MAKAPLTPIHKEQKVRKQQLRTLHTVLKTKLSLLTVSFISLYLISGTSTLVTKAHYILPLLPSPDPVRKSIIVGFGLHPTWYTSYTSYTSYIMHYGTPKQKNSRWKYLNFRYRSVHSTSYLGRHYGKDKYYHWRRRIFHITNIRNSENFRE